jgi:hypothetical protein
MVDRSPATGVARLATGAWQTPLKNQIRLTDGTVLRTLQDAADFVLGRAEREPNVWDIAAETLIEAANDPTKANVSEATKAVEVATFLRQILRRKAS